MEKMPGVKEEKSEFTVLDQAAEQGAKWISRGVDILESVSQRAGESSIGLGDRLPEEQMRKTFFLAHRDYISILQRVEEFSVCPRTY